MKVSCSQTLIVFKHSSWFTILPNFFSIHMLAIVLNFTSTTYKIQRILVSFWGRSNLSYEQLNGERESIFLVERQSCDFH